MSLGAVFFEEDAAHHLDELLWLEPSWLLRVLLLHQRALRELANTERPGSNVPLVSRDELEHVLCPKTSSSQSQAPAQLSCLPEEEDHSDAESAQAPDESAEPDADAADSVDAPREACGEHTLPPRLVAPYIRLLERCFLAELTTTRALCLSEVSPIQILFD